VNQQQTRETWVISRTDEGFRVYSPADPTKSHIVGGSPEEPTCTCPDFECDQGDPRWGCKHIQAVLDQVGAKPNGSDYDEQERRAIQHENLPEVPHKNGGAQMLLKRSVSPDGKIDSLSVEFSCAVENITAGEIKSRALKTLGLQSEIVESFLGANGKTNRQRAPQANGNNGPASAQMLTIGGINTKWGRRLYISFQSNGQTLKFFGSRKQLADAIVGAGFPNLAERLDEGKQLNVGCRIVTKPSEDGKYINVEQVLPTDTPRPQQRQW